MACPYLKEVVMLFCDAYPVKKMLPLDRIATANPCLGEFHGCPLFQESPLASSEARRRSASRHASRRSPKGRIAMILALPLSLVGLR